MRQPFDFGDVELLARFQRCACDYVINEKGDPYIGCSIAADDVADVAPYGLLCCVARYFTSLFCAGNLVQLLRYGSFE